MKVIVTGGRDYSDKAAVYRVLGEVNRQTRVECVIQGGASGADKLARSWAHDRGIQVITYEYQSGQGKAGGPIRNRYMMASYSNANEEVVCVAFPGGKGTKDAVQQARQFGIRVIP